MPDEDFACVLEQIPGAMASLGTRPEGYAKAEAANAHSDRYLLNEEAMVNGMAMHAGIALAYLRDASCRAITSPAFVYCTNY